MAEADNYEIVREGIDESTGCVYRIKARTEFTNNNNNSDGGAFTVDYMYIHEYDDANEFILHLGGRISESQRESFIQRLGIEGVPSAACIETAAIIFDDIYRVQDDDDDLAANTDTPVVIQIEMQEQDDLLSMWIRSTPASREAVAALERVDVSVGPGETCVVCLEEMISSSSSVGLNLIKMPCSHVFHGDCILNWLNNSSACPLCRFKLPEESSQG